MRFILIAFALLFVFSLSSSVKLSHTEDSFTPSSVLHIWEFAAGICRGYLPQEFAAGICRGDLPQEFAVRICRRNLLWVFATRICRRNLPWLFSVGFCIYKAILFFVYLSKSCLYGGKPFLYVCKTFWFVRFFLLTVFLLVIVMAIMGHRSILHFV